MQLHKEARQDQQIDTPISPLAQKFEVMGTMSVSKQLVLQLEGTRGQYCKPLMSRIFVCIVSDSSK